MEPVAWMVVNDDGQDVYVTTDPTLAKSWQRALPLYTAPVIDEGYTRQSSTQVRGFTDDEVRAAFNKVRESAHQLGETIAEWESKFGA